MGYAELRTGFSRRDHPVPPQPFAFVPFRAMFDGLRAEANASCLCRCNTFRLPLTNKGSLRFRDVAEQLEDNVRNQGTGQITI